jgi:molecular chaperone DnaK
LKEHADKIEADDKEAIEKAKEDLAEAAKGNDAEAIKSKVEALATAAQKMGEAIYKAQQAEAQPNAETTEESKKEDENIVDAEYEEVDKK